jgi:hypothetical protein
MPITTLPPPGTTWVLTINGEHVASQLFHARLSPRLAPE